VLLPIFSGVRGDGHLPMLREELLPILPDVHGGGHLPVLREELLLIFSDGPDDVFLRRYFLPRSDFLRDVLALRRRSGHLDSSADDHDAPALRVARRLFPI
jgi:hypothetical protein